MIYKIADNVLTPLGGTTAENYQAVKSGRTALRRYDNNGVWEGDHHSDIHDLPEPFAASLFADDSSFAIEGLTRFESLAVTSIKSALQQTDIDTSASNIILIISTTKGNGGGTYPSTAAMHIAKAVGISTTPIVVCNACISGVSAMILAQRLLEEQQYDYAIVCGAEVLNRFTVTGFQSLKALSAEPCRPFDIERTGLNLGEAAATIIFSLLPPPHPHWALVHGVVRNDAYHISTPDKNGEGARQALEEVMKGENLEDVAFINAHGTATLFNDQMESVAIERANMQDIPVNSLKGYFGHTLGAAGILETVISMAAIDDNTIIGTKGFEELGVSGKINLAPRTHPISPRTSPLSFIKLISGFGGCNGAILFKNQQPITSSIHSPLSSDFPSKGDLMGANSIKLTSSDTSLTEIYKQHIGNYPKFYKMDGLCKLGFVASELLLKQVALRSSIESPSLSVILFNHSSSIHADKKYESTISNSEEFFPSPSLFVYTLPNIVTGETAIRNHFQGETSFYILPQKDDEMMELIIKASFADCGTDYIIGGWVDYENDEHYEAELTFFDLKVQSGEAERYNKQ